MAKKMTVVFIVCVGLWIGLIAPTFAEDVPTVPVDQVQKSDTQMQKKIKPNKDLKGRHSYNKKKNHGKSKTKKKHKKNKDTQKKFKKLKKDEIKEEAMSVNQEKQAQD